MNVIILWISSSEVQHGLSEVGSFQRPKGRICFPTFFQLLRITHISQHMALTKIPHSSLLPHALIRNPVMTLGPPSYKRIIASYANHIGQLPSTKQGNKSTRFWA